MAKLQGNLRLYDEAEHITYGMYILRNSKYSCHSKVGA